MDTDIICQEILITTESQLFSSATDHSNVNTSLSQKELLTKACWNGLAQKLLPEIMPELDLININEGENFLDLRFGEYGQETDNVFSINPYLFLETDKEN